MKQEIKDRFYNGEIGIVCKNNKEAKDFVKDMGISNLRYSLEPDFIIPFFGRHEPAVYWLINKGQRPSWSSVDYAMEHGRKIVEYSDINKEEDVMEMKIKVKTFGELLGTKGVWLSDGNLRYEHEALISSKMLDFCGQEITFDESQIGRYGDCKVVHSEGSCWHEWMCSEWFNEDELEKLEEEFEELKDGIEIEGFVHTLEIKTNPIQYYDFEANDKTLWFGLENNRGVAMTLDKFDEIVEYVEKVKNLKDKVDNK